MFRVLRPILPVLLLLGLSSGVGGQAGQETSVELGDITALAKPQFPRGEVAVVGDTVSYAFTLSAPRQVGLGVRQQAQDADLVVVDASGTVLGRSAAAGSGNEWLRVALGAGRYRAQVIAQAAGVNGYVFRYGDTAGDGGPRCPYS